MKSIHDNSIHSIEILCGKNVIILHTELKGETPEYTDIIFRHVIGHHFEHILNGNILFDVEEWESPQFYKEYETELLAYERYGFPLQFSNIQTFVDGMAKQNLKAFVIGSSYGLSGWVISQAMELVAREQKYEA